MLEAMQATDAVMMAVMAMIVGGIGTVARPLFDMLLGMFFYVLEVTDHGQRARLEEHLFKMRAF